MSLSPVADKADFMNFVEDQMFRGAFEYLTKFSNGGRGWLACLGIVMGAARDLLAEIVMDAVDPLLLRLHLLGLDCVFLAAIAGKLRSAEP